MYEKNNIELKLEEKQKEYAQVRTQMSQLEQQSVQIQSAKDKLLTKGIELQGMIKILQDLLPKPEVIKPEVVETASK